MSDFFAHVRTTRARTRAQRNYPESVKKADLEGNSDAPPMHLRIKTISYLCTVEFYSKVKDDLDGWREFLLLHISIT